MAERMSTVRAAYAEGARAAATTPKYKKPKIPYGDKKLELQACWMAGYDDYITGFCDSNGDLIL